MQYRLAVLGILAAGVCLHGLPFGEESKVMQYGREQRLATGRILVASERLPDANFTESVVLIVQYDPDEGTVGIILNRPTEIPLSRAFPNIKHATSDPVYLGGPVQTEAVQALLKMSQETDQATQVIDDVYVTGKKDLIEKSIASRAEPSNFRIYLGYAGWAPQQLEAEVELGAWSVLNGRSNIVFDKNPDSLWARLTRESHSQIARTTFQLDCCIRETF